MATEQFDIENVAEIYHQDEKWIFGNIKGKNDIYSARYRLGFVADQTTIGEDDTKEATESNIAAVKFTREWLKKEQMIFPLFKLTVDVHKDSQLGQRYISAFNSQRPRSVRSFNNENWVVLMNFMGPILDDSPNRNSWDYNSDEDEWTDYESHKRRSDYGCQKGCCGGAVDSSCLSAINE